MKVLLLLVALLALSNCCLLLGGLLGGHGRRRGHEREGRERVEPEKPAQTIVINNNFDASQVSAPTDVITNQQLPDVPPQYNRGNGRYFNRNVSPDSPDNNFFAGSRYPF